MRILGGWFVFLSCLTFGQATAPRPEFDVAEIRLNKSGDADGAGSIHPGGQFRTVNMPLKELIKFAYKLRDEDLIGAPSWIGSENYDIVAKAQVAGGEETFWRPTNVVQVLSIAFEWDGPFRLMVQSLLADRFKLSVHPEERPVNVLVLTAAKGANKLQKAADSGTADCARKFTPDVGFEAVCKNMKMTDLARALQILAPAYADRTVVDLTGIEGTYDFKLNWVGINMADLGGMTMPDALSKQLGLKLEGRKMPMPVIVVDHVEKPAGN